MEKKKIITIERITPPVSLNKKKYNIQEIAKAAEAVRIAVENEERKYGKFEFTR